MTDATRFALCHNETDAKLAWFADAELALNMRDAQRAAGVPCHIWDYAKGRKVVRCYVCNGSVCVRYQKD